MLRLFKQHHPHPHPPGAIPPHLQQSRPSSIVHQHHPNSPVPRQERSSNPTLPTKAFRCRTRIRTNRPLLASTGTLRKSRTTPSQVRTELQCPLNTLRMVSEYRIPIPSTSHPRKISWDRADQVDRATRPDGGHPNAATLPTRLPHASIQLSCLRCINSEP